MPDDSMERKIGKKLSMEKRASEKEREKRARELEKRGFSLFCVKTARRVTNHGIKSN